MFRQHKNTGKAVEPFILVPATASETYAVGEALVIGTAGTVTKANGAVTPQFICQASKVGEAGEYIEATLVNAQQELETEFSASASALKVGDKVTIATDGLRVTATTTSGTFLITEILGTATGDAVRGFFMR